MIPIGQNAGQGRRVAILAPGRFDAEKIRAARKESGMTQVDLAERIGVLPTVVNDWEKRRARPSVRMFDRLASRRLSGWP